MTAARALSVALLAASATACAVVRQVGAPADDYAAYRETRVAAALDERLAAAVRYAERHPEGAFAGEVAAMIERVEPAYYASKRGSVAGLEAYLRALPTGPHSGEAVRQLKQLRARRAEAEDFGATAAAARSSIDRAVAQRGAARAGTLAWLDRFLDPVAWRGPLSGAPADLIVAWALGLPQPVCAPIDVTDPIPGRAPGAPAARDPATRPARRCSKLVELRYSLPVAGAPEEREITLEIAALEDRDGRLLEVTLGGPDLFVRLEETKEVRALAADDPAARVEAVSSAVALARAAFDKRVPAAKGCERPVNAPAVLDLSCSGMHLVVRAGAVPGEDDAFVLRAGD